MPPWEPDVLGDPFEQCTLTLDRATEHDPPLVATLVRRLPDRHADTADSADTEPPLADVDVLYVHGWSDYFFHTELAAFFADRGARFYALDLRRYGRSLRPGQRPGFVASLDDYDTDIELALDTMAADTDQPRRVVLMGHSTGGLTLTLWAARHPCRVSALILNSPWLELQVGRLGRQAITPWIDRQARTDPERAVMSLDLGYYTQAQRIIGSLPPRDLPAEWRPERGFPPRRAWGAAILEGHGRIARGEVAIDVPVLVLLSARSTSPFSWSAESTAADSVLTVEDIAYAATRIGSYVTIGRIEYALHDIFLSLPTPRSRAYDVLKTWVCAHLATSAPAEMVE